MPFENTGDFETLRKPSRYVLHGVNSHIDRSGDKSLFNLLRKEPFPTNLGESSVLHAIRRRLNDNDLDSIRFMQFWVGTTQRPPDPMSSEEHTSEFQSLMRISYAVFCWKTKNIITLNCFYTT